MEVCLEVYMEILFENLFIPKRDLVHCLKGDAYAWWMSARASRPEDERSVTWIEFR